jgi:excisionase family DNA binding protein
MKAIYSDALAGEADRKMAMNAKSLLLKTLEAHDGVSVSLVYSGAFQSEAPNLDLPKSVLPFFAEVLGVLALGKPVVLMQGKTEMTSQEAADFLGVSRLFVVREIDRGKLACRMVGLHRRIEQDELRRYKDAQRRVLKEPTKKAVFQEVLEKYATGN